MLDIRPDAEQITALIGKSLYGVWSELCALIDKNYDMECLWDKGGKRGNMNINTAGVAKRYVHYMQEKIVWDLWLSWEKTSA